MENVDTSVVIAPDELSSLKDRAKFMGLNFHPNIGLQALKAKIEAHKAGESLDDYAVDGVEPKKKRESIAQRNNRLRKEANRLVRVHVTCMNPTKKDFQGQIFSVSNAAIGTIKKMIQFDAEFHIPIVLLNVLKDKKYQTFYDVKLPNGNKMRKGRLVKEFAINILDDLTLPELQELATQQGVNRSID